MVAKIVRSIIATKQFRPTSLVKTEDLSLTSSIRHQTSYIFLLPDNQVARQSYFLCLATQAINIIMFSHVVIKLAQKCTTNTCTLLIDRVQQWICHILNTLKSPIIQPIWFQFDINLRQLLSIVWQVLKKYSLWMSKKQ